jgi:hypothetical protein
MTSGENTIEIVAIIIIIMLDNTQFSNGAAAGDFAIDRPRDVTLIIIIVF